MWKNMIQDTIEATVITTITARPILRALDSFFDTPKKGHSPKNFDNTKLLIRAILMNIANRLSTLNHPRIS